MFSSIVQDFLVSLIFLLQLRVLKKWNKLTLNLNLTETIIIALLLLLLLLIVMIEFDFLL